MGCLEFGSHSLENLSFADYFSFGDSGPRGGRACGSESSAGVGGKGPKFAVPAEDPVADLAEDPVVDQAEDQVVFGDT